MVLNNDYLEQLLFEQESNSLDFKSQQYKFINGTDEEKSELLKDILSFANSFRRTDAVILIGVQEIKGNKSNVLGISELFDDASIQQFVNSKTNKSVEFSYQNRQLDTKTIAVIHIPIQQRPIYLKKDFGKLKKNVVYLRRGTSTDEATIDEIVKMGLTASPERNMPDLKLTFINRDKENHEIINVKSYKTYEKSVLLGKLQNLVINEADLQIVRKYKNKLEMFMERLPNGSVCHPYSASHIEDFIKRNNEISSLIETDIECFCKCYNLRKRSFSLDYALCGISLTCGNPPGYGSLFSLHNEGTSPSLKMIVYIKSNPQIEFIKYKEMKKRNIEIDNKLPEDIVVVIEKAKKIAKGLPVPDSLFYQENTIDTSLFDRAINQFDSAEKSILISINKGIITYEIKQELMHNHSISMQLGDIFLCPMIKKDEIVNIEYEIHASNLPKPVLGSLQAKGI